MAGLALQPLVNGDCSVRVSSVLNRDNKQYGKKFMFDGQEETCWNSDQGPLQYITFEFRTPVLVQELHIKFQGGFVGRTCILQAGNSQNDLIDVLSFYPEDVSSKQIFTAHNTNHHKMYKIILKDSSDFFGRITIYSLQLYSEN